MNEPTCEKCTHYDTYPGICGWTERICDIHGNLDFKDISACEDFEDMNERVTEILHKYNTSKRTL